MIFKDYYKTFLILVIIIILSLSPSNAVHEIAFINIPQIDKVIHFFMYFFLALSSFIDIKNNIKKPTKLLILSVIFSLVIIGGIIEVIQETFIFGRSGSWLDLLADIFGILFASLLFYKISISVKFHQDH